MEQWNSKTGIIYHRSHAQFVLSVQLLGNISSGWEATRLSSLVSKINKYPFQFIKISFIKSPSVSTQKGIDFTCVLGTNFFSEIKNHLQMFTTRDQFQNFFLLLKPMKLYWHRQFGQTGFRSHYLDFIQEILMTIASTITFLKKDVNWYQGHVNDRKAPLHSN